MLDDILFWLQTKIYDYLEVHKPGHYSNIQVALTAGQIADYRMRGNVLQIKDFVNPTPAVTGEPVLFVRFNERNSPEYQVTGDRTFFGPFYRIWFRAVNSVGFTFWAGKNTFEASDIGVDLSGPRAEALRMFDSCFVESYTILAAGGTQILLPSFATFNRPMYLRAMRLNNTSMTVTLEIYQQGGGVGANWMPMYPTAEWTWEWSAPWRINSWALSGNHLVARNNHATDNADLRVIYWWYQGVDV